MTPLHMPAPSAAVLPLPAWGNAPEPEEAARRLDRHLQVVLGKGGVGRTLVASALAKRAADAGHRTLLLEVDAPDSAARQLRVKPAVDHPREVLNNLWLCRMTPDGALKEYALMTLRFQALYRLVFENRLVKYFLKSIPSLGEFTMLGKAWHHATEPYLRGGLRFQRVIIDAPATGHAITFLSLARLVADIAPPGILASASTKMAELLEDADATCFHVVTLAEEMPVNEALELTVAGREKLRMAPGIGVVNRLSRPVVFGGEADGLRRLRDDGLPPEVAPFIDVALRRQRREAVARRYIDRFVSGTGLPWLALPDLPPDQAGHRFVDAVAQQLDALAAGALRPLSDEVHE